MATFAQYAMSCAAQALDDAGWHPTLKEDLEATVRLTLLLQPERQN